MTTSGDPLSEIAGYRQISETVMTAGQPTAQQLQEVAANGIEVVINLGLHDGDYALADEKGLVESLGLSYEHIPVLWQQPSVQDFERFVAIMHQYRDQKQLIHCAANKRVSVFMALYHICACGWPRDLALRDLEAYWTPNEVWQAFITQVLESKLGGINATL